jgi:putative two-component system response regulator
VPSESKPSRIGCGQDFPAAGLSRVGNLQALELSTALQLAALVESSDDAVIVLSLDGLIATWSQGAERLFGYSQTDVVGQRFTMLSPAAHAEHTESLIDRMLAGGEVERINTERIAKDGRLLKVALVISPINSAAGELVGIAAIVRDLSAQKLAEEQLQASDELYRSVVEALEEGVVLQDATGRILAVNHSAAGMLGIPESELIGRTSSVGSSSTPGSVARLIHEDGSPLFAGERPAIVSIRTGRPQAGIVVGAERVDGSTSWLSVNSSPLRHPHEAQPYAAVSSITDITSTRTTLQQLQAARLEDLKRLALAAEYRDDDTHQHTERVAVLAEWIARELGMDPQMVATIRLAAPLHDIGKLGIPDQILLKPGGLDEAERAVMKTHTTIGARILGDSEYPVLGMAREIALVHHERWDGAGYPAGLATQEIPIAGRIVAVADVFDAITHARPYKQAFSSEHALAQITCASGAQFDARVVDAFLACVGDAGS